MELAFRVEGEGLAEANLVGFRGVEALSRCFRIDVFVTVPDAGALDATLGAKLILHVEGDEPYQIAGIAAEVAILHEMPSRALARIALVPRLWRLGLSAHSRLYTEKSVPDVVKDVLTRTGLSDGTDFEMRLSGSYSAEAHVCQYHESDLHFVQRWLEHEGIHYFFEHQDGVDKLVICDDSTSAAKFSSKPVRYHPVAGDDGSAGTSFRRFSAQRSSRTKDVTLRDYDYAKPDLDVSGHADAHSAGFGSLVSFGDDRFLDAGRGDALAKVRAEEQLSLQASFHAEGRALHLRSGFRFELSEHTIASLDGEYLCVELEHYGNITAHTPELKRLTGLERRDVYRARLTCIGAKTPFRPAQNTDKPRVYGYLTAVVDGPADSDYAQIDDQGRYRVKLHLDESDLKDGKATTALRMQQPHVGNPEGMHFPLRKGTEVLVACLDGDPDRPLIAGAVPNKVNPSKVTSANHTHNVIHTGGNSILDVEDQSGSQWIDFSTPTKNTFFHLGKPYQDRTHNIVLHTDGNCLFDFGTNQDINVGGKLEEIVQKDVKETYTAKQTSLVMGKQTTTVTDATEETYNSTQDTLTLGQVTERYQVDHTTTVTAAPRDEMFLATQTTNVSGGGLTQLLTGAHTRIVAGPSTETLASYERHVTGSTTQLYAGPVTRIWGPNTATFKSLNLCIPGGVTEVHATHQDNVPTHTTHSIIALKLGVIKLELAYLYHGGNVLKVSGNGVSMSGIGAKGEITVIGITLNGAKCEFNAWKSKVKWGPGFKFAGFLIVV
jgi:type VI secretion system secreted protein VgrG